MIHRIFFLSFIITLYSCEEQQIDDRDFKLIPYPHDISIGQGSLDLSQGFKLESEEPSLLTLQRLLEEEFFLLTGLHNDATNTEAISIIASINPNFAKEEYQIKIENNIIITGSSQQAILSATTSIWQLLGSDLKLPKVEIKDQSHMAYRAMMIDCARQWHSINTLKQIITLARFYKANYIHLHLTDDQLFTFQSDTYPTLATEGYSYTKEELIDLNQYAFERGVILIPELDVPGHASQFIKKEPSIFGIKDLSKNSYTMSMANEDAYDALETIIGEIAEIFKHSPYIHIGGDEAHFAGMEEDPATISYMQSIGFDDIHELFRHFIIRMNDIVKKNGKQTMVWAGFSREGKIEIPKDIIVIIWESEYYDPQLMIEDGYQVINASFKPLYVVNNRTWKPSYIYNTWTPYKWEEGTNMDTTFAGLTIPQSDRVLGGSLCSWEQSQLVELPRMSQRLAVMNETLWGTSTHDFSMIQKRLISTERKLEKLLYPFNVSTSGTFLQDANESNYLEHLWFSDKVEITIDPRIEDLDIQYQIINNRDTLIDKITTLTTLELSQSSSIEVTATDKNSKQIGHRYYSEFYLHPITILKQGLENNLLASDWNKSRFTDSIQIELSSSRPGKIYYKTQGDREEKLYTSPLIFYNTTHITVSLRDEKNNTIGSPLRESYYKLINQTCLTTGKNIIASNERVRPGKAKAANNGRIGLWEHWSDTKNGNNWLEVDLGEVQSISKYHVHFFWDEYRYYQYDIETSLDGDSWSTVVDESNNTAKATIEGHEHNLESHQARYLRLNVHHNSANPGLHVTEFCAY